MKRQATASLNNHISTGILLGLAVSLLLQFKISSTYLFSLLGLFGIYYLLSSYHAHRKSRVILSSLICSAIASIPVYYWQHHTNYSGSSINYTPISMIIAFISAYAINAFHLAYYARGKEAYYDNLFFAVWDTFIEGIIALLFFCIVWSFIYLCVTLFSLLHLNIRPIINSPWFYPTVSSLLLSIGLYIALKTNRVVQHIRQITVLVCKYLLPILTIISLLFLIAWLTSGVSLTQAGQTKQWVFLWISIFTILLFNGVFQEGKAASPYPTTLDYLIRAQLIIAPVFSVLALASFLKSSQMTSVVIQVINYGLLIAYGLAYAVIAFIRQKPWMHHTRKANIALAIILILSAFITNNPWFHHIVSSDQGEKKTRPLKSSNTNKLTTFTKNFEKNGFKWIEKKTNAINIVIAGYNPEPIYLCLAKGALIVGTATGDADCQYIHNGTVEVSKHFRVLSASKKVNWRTSPFNKNIFYAGYQSKKLLTVCRTIIKNHIAVGIGHSYQCQVIKNKQILTVGRFIQHLTFR